MTDFSLGQTPHRMTTVLSPGADFVATLTRNDGVDWPVGTGVQLVVEGQVAPWAAVVAGPSLTWEIDEAVVDAVIATNLAKKGKLYYINGTTRILWASGPVVVA